LVVPYKKLTHSKAYLSFESFYFFASIVDPHWF
jgi:hypothetical protein